MQIGWTFDPDSPTYMVREPDAAEIIHGYQTRAYLWSRTILCRSCTALIPLSPQWQLSKDVGILLWPDPHSLVVGFEAVPRKEMSSPTIKKGIATCPVCGASTPRGYPAAEARADRMGHVEYCRVKRWHYPIYRAGKRPRQGKGPMEFQVPNGGGFWHSVKERERVLGLAGMIDQTWQTDPRLAHIFDPDYEDDGLTTLLDLAGLPAWDCGHGSMK